VQGTYTSGISGTGPAIWASGSSSPITIRNLAANTAYTVVVRATCSAGGTTPVATVDMASAKKLDNNLRIKVSNNPVSDGIVKLSGALENTSYTIVNLFGQKLLSGQLSNDSIDVFGLASGMYLLQVSNGKDNFIEKIIIE